jgi:lysophospholipase L1-like esterase
MSWPNSPTPKGTAVTGGAGNQALAQDVTSVTYDSQGRALTYVLNGLTWTITYLSDNRAATEVSGSFLKTYNYDAQKNFIGLSGDVNVGECRRGLFKDRPVSAVAGDGYFATDLRGGMKLAHDGTRWRPANAGSARRVVFVGDSLTASINGAPQTTNLGGLADALVGSNGGLNGSLTSSSGPVMFHGAERNCPSGNGTLTYTKASNSITWQANGDSGPGAAVVLDRTKRVKLDSGTAGHGIWVTLRPGTSTTTNLLPAADATDATVNVGATAAGYLPVVQSQNECFADLMKGQLGPEYTVVGKLAQSGNWIHNITEQLDDIVAMLPDRVVLMIGTNDLAGARTVAAVTADYSTLIDYFTSCGIEIDVLPIMPRGDSGLQQKITAVNRFLALYCRKSPFSRFRDIYSVLQAVPAVYQSATPFGTDTTLFQADKLHFSRKGVLAMAAALAAKMKAADAPTRIVDPYDLFSASNNPNGNLISNGQMLVTSGRPSGVPDGAVASAAGVNFNANSTGTVPDDWTCWPTGTMTAVNSVVDRSTIDASDPTGGKLWKVNITAAGTGLIRLFINLALANFSPADLVEFFGDAYFDNPSLFTRFDMALDFSGADRLSFGQNTGDSIGTGTTQLRLPVASPVFKVPASWAWTGQAGNPGTIRLYVNLNVSAAANFYLGNVGLRKVF